MGSQGRREGAARARRDQPEKTAGRLSKPGQRMKQAQRKSSTQPEQAVRGASWRRSPQTEAGREGPAAPCTRAQHSTPALQSVNSAEKTMTDMGPCLVQNEYLQLHFFRDR